MLFRSSCSPLSQENAKNEEILNCLKYVRPGGGFEPNFMLFEKCEVNGEKAHPLFAFLREVLPTPSDDATALMTDPKFITWSPVCRNDVSWNFEKFLVGPDGVPVRRSSLSAIRVVSSAYMRLLIFFPAILIPACVSSSPAFLMMYSA